MPYKVGIVGCGVIGRRLAAAFYQVQETRITAVCDLNQAKAKTLAMKYNTTNYQDYRVMIEQEDLDILYIGVPPAHHLEIVRFGLQMGLHIICEKPIALDAAQGMEMTKLSSESNQVTAINLPFRYTPSVREFKTKIVQGYVGEIQRIELRFRFPRWPREWQDVAWLGKQYQGGPLREVGTHFYFAIHELVGKISKVLTIIDYPDGENAETSAIGIFELENGIKCSLDLLTKTMEKEENSITVIGTKGKLSLTDWYILWGSQTDQKMEILNDKRINSSIALIENFVQAIDEDGNSTLVTFEEATSVQKVLDAIIESKGKWIEI